MKIIDIATAAAAISAVDKNSYWKASDAKGKFICGMKIPYYNLLRDYNEHNGEIPMHVVIEANQLSITFVAGEGDNVTFIAREVNVRGGKAVLTKKSVFTLNYLSSKAIKLNSGAKIFEAISEIVPATKEELADLQGDSSSEANKAKQSIYDAYLAKKNGEDNE